MVENIDILYGVATQSLTFDAPEGQPASVTASTVYENSYGDDDTAETALSGSAAISSVSTTFDAASGESESNPNTLNVASTVGISIGDQLIAENAAGETEVIVVRQITSGASLESRHPLANDYTTGDTLKGLTVTHALLDAWTADKTNISDTGPQPRYRWRLEYVGADSKTHVHHAYFDLVRYSGTSTVTGLDVDAAYPWLDWLNNLPVHDREDRGARIIKEAYRQVKLTVATAGKADEGIRNREVIEELVMNRAASIVAGRDLEAQEAIAKMWDRSYNNFILAGQTDTDDDGSGAATESDSSQVWRR